MPDSSPQISIIIVSHNSLSVLSGCLKALGGAIGKMSSEVIVVDNASSDQTVKEVARWFPGARILANTKNVGFARACNQGADVAIGEYLVFLNPDVEPDPDAFARLLAAVQARSDAGLVSGRLRYPDGTFQATCRRFPTIGNLIFSRGSALGGVLSSSGARGAYYTLPDFAETTEVPAVAATMAIVSRTLFARVGGFDKRFFMFMEDTELSLRLEHLGNKNLFVPSAGGVHHWGQGARASRTRRAYYHHVSMWKYFLKHVPNGFSVVLLPLLLLVNLILVIILPAQGARSADK